MSTVVIHISVFI